MCKTIRNYQTNQAWDAIQRNDDTENNLIYARIVNTKKNLNDIITMRQMSLLQEK